MSALQCNAAPAYVTGIGYTASMEPGACALHGAIANTLDWLGPAEYFFPAQSQAEAACIRDCNTNNTPYSYRGRCQSIVITNYGSGFAPNRKDTLWHCDFYRIPLPSEGIHDKCPGQTYSTVFGIYPETIMSCLASSRSAATAFCSSYLSLGPMTATSYEGASAAVTLYVTASVTETSHITIPVTETAHTAGAPAVETSYVGISVTDTAYVTVPVEETLRAAAAPAIATSYVAASVTETSYVTVPVTETSYAAAANPGVSTITATETVTKSVCKLSADPRTTGPASAARPAVLFRRLAPQDPVTRVMENPNAQVTEAPDEAELALVHLQGRQAVPAPSCLNTASTNTPRSLISSACSCLRLSVAKPTTVRLTTTTTITSIGTTTAPVVNLAVTTTTPVTLIITTTDTITTVMTTTAPVVNMAITRTTAVTKVITTTDTITSIVTTKVPVNMAVTMTASVTLAMTTTAPITSTTTTTTTVTTSVLKSTIETFALLVRAVPTGGPAQAGSKKPPKSSSSVYRLLTRMNGASENPENRIMQYRKRIDSKGRASPDSSYRGINATIIDGSLYVMSRYNNPKLHGLGKIIPPGHRGAGRKVLGAQDQQLKAYQLKAGAASAGGSGGFGAASSIPTAMTGCTIDQANGNVIKCRLAGGGQEAIRFQELPWPTNPTRKFMLGMVPQGSGGGRGQKMSAEERAYPIMELAATDFGTVAVGCPS